MKKIKEYWFPVAWAVFVLGVIGLVVASDANAQTTLRDYTTANVSHKSQPFIACLDDASNMKVNEGLQASGPNPVILNAENEIVVMEYEVTHLETKKLYGKIRIVCVEDNSFLIEYKYLISEDV